MRKLGYKPLLSKEKTPFAKGTLSYISSFVCQIDELWDGWCSVVLCGIVLSQPAQRGRTLIIAGLCRLLSRGQGLSEWWRGVQEGGGGGSPSDKAWWRWAHGCGGRWRESSPMMTQLELPSRSQRRTHAERNRENTGSGPKEWWKTEKNERTYKLVLFTWMHAKGWLKVT